MPITTTPAPARTDESAGRTPASTSTARRTGMFLAAGSVIWSAAMFVANPQSTDGTDILINDIGGLGFQASLFALITLQLRTGATGTTRFARGLLRTEYVLLSLATLWTVLHAAFPAARDDLWLAVLDVFWPLSMLGMFIIGVKIAFAGRWKGVARFWPLVAESWAVVTVPAFGILGATAGQYVGAAHLLAGYLVLGLILARRPHLTF